MSKTDQIVEFEKQIRAAILENWRYIELHRVEESTLKWLKDCGFDISIRLSANGEYTIVKISLRNFD